MTKGLFKDFLREIKKSLNRFISIMCIVAIGTAFFVGLKSSAPDMSYTMDQYYDQYHIMDLEVLSTLGLTDEDLDAIAAIDGVEQVQPGYFTDALTYFNGSEIVFRIHSLPQTYLDGDESVLNQVKVVEGRLPEKPNEIVVEQNLNMDYGMKIGDTLVFESGSADALTDGVMHGDTYTVVGLVITPYYLSYDKGTSQISGKPISLFAYVPEAAFDYGGIYTDALVSVQGAQELNAFNREYRELVNHVSVELSNIGVDRAEERGESLRKEAYAQLEEAQKELDAQLSDFNTQIAQAEKDLAAAEQELIEGEKELAVQKEKYELEIRHAEDEIAAGEKELEAAAQQIAEGEEAVRQGQIDYENAKAQYDAAMEQNQKYIDMLHSFKEAVGRLETQMNETLTKLEALENDPEATEEEKILYRELCDIYEVLYNETYKNYQEIVALNDSVDNLVNAIERTLTTTEEKLAQSRQQLAEAREQYNAGLAELNQGRAELEAKQNEADKQFADAQTKLDEGRKQYDEGKAELEKQRADGQKQLDDAELQLIDAKYQIDLMEHAVWYLLDRSMNYGFASYQSTVDRMAALSQIMPVFFILVAVLVCMTTMTRMVAEQRTTIGTYKALGYNDNAISSKYVLYVASASLIGSVIGAVLGGLFFPKSVYMAWSAMYSQPAFSQTVHPVIVLSSMAVSVVAMMLTAYYTCHVELRTEPSQLMRPKAPKLGKTILLERVGFIWSHLNFSQKVTARNIFRYKKRLFMTIIGIMGCTALLLAGLGINDTISTVVENQYEKVFRYDISAEMKESITPRQKEALVKRINDQEIVTQFGYAGTTSFTLTGEDGTKITSSAYVTEDPQHFSDYIMLANRSSGEPIELTDDGIVLSEKLAEQLGVSAGDSVTVTSSDNISKKLTVNGITENYVFHYVYMSQACYEQNFWYSVNQNSILIKLNPEATSEQVAAVCSAIEEADGVASVVAFTDLAADFQDQISALKSIIVLIIVCAALLAFVVLYNLTNINISERIKEIATIKVLGFKSHEVAMYVYRENFLLTLMGGVLGLGLGVGLHRVIIRSIEQSNVMFGYLISPMSFVVALVMTCLFSILVMLYMYRKLSNIPMVESLKAIE